MNAADPPPDEQDWHPREAMDIFADFAAGQDRPKAFVDAATAMYVIDYELGIDTLCERAIARGLDEDAVQLLLAEAKGRAANAPRKPNGGIHQDANGNLRQAPEQRHHRNGSAGKPESLHTWDQPDWSLLEDRRGDLPEFPLNVLDAGWQAWARETSHGSGTSVAHVVVPLLALSPPSLASRGAYRFRARGSSRSECGPLWLVRQGPERHPASTPASGRWR
jgi:hypothetical protein